MNLKKTSVVVRGVLLGSACAAVLMIGLSAGGCQSAKATQRGLAVSEQVQTGFIPKVIDVGGRSYRYAVWVPPEYTNERAWPAILFLHGKGECGDDGVLHTKVGLGKAISENPERFPAVVIMPQMPVGSQWVQPGMQTLALATLDAAEHEYRIDSKRIVLTGLSLGGFGTWALGAKEPERFCALAPVCGGGDPANAPVLARLPIWCFHGDSDPVVPVERSRQMVVAVKVAGGSVQYSEFPGVQHNSWDPAYGDAAVIAWMLAQHR